jgi:hypothetical protein
MRNFVLSRIKVPLLISLVQVVCYSIILLSLIGNINLINAQRHVNVISNDTKPIFIKEWLMVGPFPSSDVNLPSVAGPKRNGYSTDYLEHVGGENEAKITASTVITTASGNKIEFLPYHLKEEYINLIDLYGEKKNVCAYLYTELESDKEQKVILHIGSNDACKLWANGKLMTYYSGDRSASRSQNTCQVNLKPGRTPILLKIDQGGGGWGAFVEVYGATAHKNFLEVNFPKTLDISLDNQLPAIGDTVQASIVKYPNLNWLEFDGAMKWTLNDRGSKTAFKSSAKRISFVVPEGDERILKLQANKQIGSREVNGTLQFLARQKNEKIFAESDKVLDIGNRRELFVDHYLIHKLVDARLVLHEPRDEGEVIRFDKPWEGLFSAYFTIIKDIEKYRAYYRGMAIIGKDGNENEVTCYAESMDGVTWEKPNLGIYDIMGRHDNNVVLANDVPFSHNFSPFLDTNPNTEADEKFKAVAGTMKSGLFGFTSKDGIHWNKISSSPIFTNGIFDSQNVVFWSQSEKCYVCYFRVWSGPGFSGIRTISRTTSKDFLHWTEPQRMDFGYMPLEQLYTNQTHPYFRAPHIYISIAARFMPNRQVISEEQAAALQVNSKYFKDCSDVIFMSSRGGYNYDRTFMESFIRPGIGLENWVSRSNYPALNVVQTSEDEMSIYLNQSYAQPTAHLRRYSLRLDGFSSINTPYTSGEMVSKLLTFNGKQLVINFNTSAAGYIKVEILDTNGNPIQGYELKNADELIGNEIEKVVTWKGNSDVHELINKPIMLRFVMKDADLYSLRFK